MHDSRVCQYFCLQQVYYRWGKEVFHTMTKELLEIICLLGLVQGVFLGMVLATKRQNTIPNRFLAAFLLAVALGMGARYASFKGIKLSAHNIYAYLLVLPALFGPLIFLYAETLMHRRKTVDFRQLFHLIYPFLILLGAVGITVFFPHGAHPRDYYQIRYFIFTSLSVSFFGGLLYVAAALYRLKMYRNHLEEFFSSTEKLNLKWLNILLTLMLLSAFSWNIGIWSNLAFGFKQITLPVFLSQLLLLVVIFFTTYYALKQPEIFGLTAIMEDELAEPEADSAAGPRPENNSRKYQKHSIDEATMAGYMEKLKRYMNDKKPYLRESLTLKDLAEDLEISSHHLSMVINSELNQNFYHFVNSYRVTAAQNIIAAEQSRGKSFLEVAYDAGFSSKTTFNAMFKKFTGMTPTEYKNSREMH